MTTSMPIVSVASVAKGLKCSQPTANKAIHRLVELAYMDETKGSTYARQVAASRMMAALFALIG